MKHLPHTRSCFVCGESNSHGLKLRFTSDGQRVHTRFTPRPEHIGFKGVTHGGILATVLDEIMVWAVAVATRRFAFCAELTVRFQQPAKSNDELTVTAELVANRRNKVFEAKAELRDAAGQIVATATGKYLPVPTEAVPSMLTELVGDCSVLEADNTLQP
ncbi:MAG: PaaI family thioesterase [Verrucomicrobia bacterium]|nr:PaaI family thioesterase [Verrucomicrobiota bacterium]